MITYATRQPGDITSRFMPGRGLPLQPKCACGLPTSSLTGECAECKSNKLLRIKLDIGASNDPLEQEADRIADQVLAAPANLAGSDALPRIQDKRGKQGGQKGTDHGFIVLFKGEQERDLRSDAKIILQSANRNQH